MVAKRRDFGRVACKAHQNTGSGFEVFESINACISKPTFVEKVLCMGCFLVYNLHSVLQRIVSDFIL